MNKDRSLSPNVLPNEHPDFVLNFVMSVTGISTVSAQVGRAIFPVLYSISTKVSSVGMLSGELPIRRKLASHNFNAPDAQTLSKSLCASSHPGHSPYTGSHYQSQAGLGSFGVRKTH